MGILARKQPGQVEYDVSDDDNLYSTRSRSSARRYRPPVEHDTLDDPLLHGGVVIRRRSRALTNPGSATRAIAIPPAEVEQRHRRFPMLPVLVGMLVMALLVYSLTTFSSWWRIHQDDVQFGRPRTFQLDAAVGHNDSPAHPTHFIFINLNRHIEIIELPGGDSAHARIYPGPALFGDGQDLIPVTADIRDVNGDGKPDLIVHIQDQQLVFINDGTQFRPLRQGEHVNL